MDSIQNGNGRKRAHGKSVEQTVGAISQLLDKVVLLVGDTPEDVDSLARSFARNGADVAIMYRNENRQRETAVDEAARHIKAAVEAAGRRCLLLKCRPGGEQFPRKAVGRIIEEFGRLDAFVTYTSPDPAGQTPLQQWQTRANGRFTTISSDVTATAVLFPHLSLMKAAMDEIVPDTG